MTNKPSDRATDGKKLLGLLGSIQSEITQQSEELSSLISSENQDNNIRDKIGEVCKSLSQKLKMHAEAVRLFPLKIR